MLGWILGRYYMRSLQAYHQATQPLADTTLDLGGSPTRERMAVQIAAQLVIGAATKEYKARWPAA